MNTSVFDTAFEKIKLLVREYESNHNFYLSTDYNESQARMDYIDKLFTILGWDVNHERQKNPYEQEVKVERPVATGQSQRSADYALYIVPNFRDPLLFVEAKKPSKDLAAPNNCFQAVRYGWNAGTPIAILSNFEQLIVLDSRYKPDIDTAADQVCQKYHYSEYLNAEKFAKIFYLIGRDPVAAGSLDKYAETLPRRRGKAVQRGLFKGGWQPVDEAFLEDLDGYRDELARNFKNHNQQLDGETLTEITQRTLDRLVFLRFLEDKLIEAKPYVSEFGTKGNPWREFIASCRKLDHIYNGIVFKTHEILDSSSLKVDEEQFANLCEKLAHLNSPYDFNSFPIHILGSIYERFLGKVIVVTNKRATVELRPEVRKAGGVYYTPNYIVRYIVANTIEKIIAGKNPSQIAEMRFADISCGSGSFLVAIYDSLLRYHFAWYNDHPNRAEKEGCTKGDDGNWHLSLGQKRKILKNNVFGVDIDHQAVEVAQMSLYLKLMEEETTASSRNYQLEIRETILPPLNKNIVSGNSLIGTDILDGQLFPAEEERKVNPMNFEDSFPEVMRRGGFDAIVGNPPWLMAGYYVKESLDYIGEHYLTAKGKFDLYYTFIERGIRLISENGLFGMIVPNKFFHTSAASKLRSLISHDRWVRKIVDFGDEQIFDGATNYSCILFLQRKPGDNPNYIRAKAGLKELERFEVPWPTLSGGPWHFEKSDKRDLFAKIEAAGSPLEELAARFGTGVQSGADKLLIIDPFAAQGLNFEGEALRPVLRGRDVRRYEITDKPKLLIFPYDVKNGEFTLLSEARLKRLKNVYRYLIESKSRLAKRIWFGRSARELSGDWFGMMYLDGQRWFTAPHILTPSLSNQSNFALDSGHMFVTGTAGVTSVVPKEDLPEDIRYLLGILNSRLISFYVIGHSPVFSGGYYKFSAPYLKKIPIRRIDFSNSPAKEVHDTIVQKVEALLDAKKMFAKARSDKDKDYYDKKAAAYDNQIDQLVYELYGLNEDEKKLVEDVEEHDKGD